MRSQVVRSALNVYDKIKQKDESGEEPMYRPREWKKEERAKNRRDRRRDWFKGKRKKNESVIFVPATPGGELKKRFQRVMIEAKIGISVVESVGTSMKKRLHKSDPLKADRCNKWRNCMVCGGEKKGRCREESITYELRCGECECRYVGETSRNAYTRGLEHKTAVNKKDTNSPLYQHCVDYHEARQVPFKMKVTGTFQGDALKRQLSESVSIQETPPQMLLNRRDECRQVLLPRVGLCVE